MLCQNVHMNNEEFHAIIVDKSQKDLEIFQNLNIIGKKLDEDWILYRISVLESELEKIIKVLQDNMLDSTWYFHFYNTDGSKLIIVFKERTFYTDNNKENWKESIEYGESLGIPKEQLDFYPNTFLEETY